MPNNWGPLPAQAAIIKAIHQVTVTTRNQCLVLYLQENPRLTEDFVAHLETELEQSRLRETETLGALREMQDKVLDMEKVWLGKETQV